MSQPAPRPNDTVVIPPPSDARRAAALERLLATEHLPTPPAVAMQVVKEASNPDVTTARIGDILRQDPALCARVLRAINSVVYGIREQVTSVERAVLLLGLNAVRGLVLAMSLPAMQASRKNDRAFRDFWQSAVSGAVIGRELAVRLRVPTAPDDMLAGLLRDIGHLLLQQTFPDEYAGYTRRREGRPFSALPGLEREAFGVDHADASAELLRRWNLPDSLVQPIRHHHAPAGLGGVGADLKGRCERLGFVDALAHLDVVAHSPEEVDGLLGAAERYGFDQPGLVAFLERVVPMVSEFTALLNVDVGELPNYAATLARGSSELFLLSVGSGGGLASSGALTPLPPPDPGLTVTPAPAGGRPPFRPAFVDDFPPGGCVLDGYELRAVLGRGAMGVVFEGYDPTLARKVAVKMVRPDMADADHARMRFIREAQSVAAVRCENVVAIHAVKEAGPLTHLVMELVDGPSLADRIAAGPPLAADELTALAVQVSRGLAAAHARKIVHRDVKPENILLDRASGQAKLTDFGLAQVEADVKLTADGGLLGTPLYMSPEQARGRTLGPAADLFSLVAVLYAAAVGRSPFDDTTVYAVLKKVCEETPPPPSRFRRDLPPWFDPVVMRLLAKAEADRYPSAEAVAAAVAAPERAGR